MQIHEPLQNAWKFFATTLLITIAVGMTPVAFIYIVSSFSSSSSLEVREISLFIVGQILVLGIFSLLYILAWSFLTHVLLQITGGSTFTLRRTMQAILYGGGALIAGVVPCIGGLLSFVWWLVASTNMVAKGQRVHGGRASFATLLGPMLIFTFVCGGYLMLMFAISAPIIAKTQMNMQQKQQQVQQQSLKEEQPEVSDETQN